MSFVEENVEFGALVSLQEDVVGYVLEWQIGPEEDGVSEAMAMVVMKRAGGLLLGVPVDFIPAEELDVGGSAMVGLVGPSCRVTVPGVIVEGGSDGQEQRIGVGLEVLLVDLDASVAQQLRLAEPVEEVAIPFLADDPFAFPDSQTLLQVAQNWFVQQAAGAEQSDAWYSVDTGQEVTDQGVTPSRRTRNTRQGSAVPGGASPIGKQQTPKAKRPTTASLQASLDTVLQTLPQLSQHFGVKDPHKNTIFEIPGAAFDSASSSRCLEPSGALS